MSYKKIIYEKYAGGVEEVPWPVTPYKVKVRRPVGGGLFPPRFHFDAPARLAPAIPCPDWSPRLSSHRAAPAPRPRDTGALPVCREPGDQPVRVCGVLGDGLRRRGQGIVAQWTTDLFFEFLAQFQALEHPTRAACTDLLGAHAHRGLIGACNPMLWPMHVFR